ncbi:hypothetical protein CDL15_Pgr009440 [Punica granatum]|uniref:Uncharacterized protein n=1 Tax=Punica granatum TaxID=22663 RepID=A0A218WT63_PUNGR|nr:hypothetical protein CDL15_Pgr009440 [Punica granatum]
MEKGYQKRSLPWKGREDALLLVKYGGQVQIYSREKREREREKQTTESELQAELERESERERSRESRAGTPCLLGVWVLFPSPTLSSLSAWNQPLPLCYAFLA